VSGYVLGAAVEFDLEEIWEYIAADNIDAADGWIGKLIDAFEALGQTPRMGHRREDLTRYPVLFWPVGTYLLIYRDERPPIEIVAVTQGSRDIPAFSAVEFATDIEQENAQVVVRVTSRTRQYLNGRVNEKGSFLFLAT
jgi:plasmid stabilization system protein ParE